MSDRLFDMFRASVMSRKGISRAEALEHFLAEVRQSEGALDDLARVYFEQKSRAFWQTPNENGIAFRRVGYVRSAKEIAAAEKRTSAEMERIKTALRSKLLMDMELPNGKPLRLATGAECERAGGFYKEVAKAILPTQVVDRHLTESDLQNIRSRYYQRNAA